MHALRERKSFQTHILHICCMLSIMKIDCGFNDVHLEAKRFWKAPPRTLIHHQRCCWGVKWRGGDQHVHMWDVYSHGYCSCGILNLWYSRVKIHQYQNHYTCVKFLFYSFLPHKLPFWNETKKKSMKSCGRYNTSKCHEMTFWRRRCTRNKNNKFTIYGKLLLNFQRFRMMK